MSLPVMQVTARGSANAGGGDMPLSDTNEVHKVVFIIVVHWLADWQKCSEATIRKQLDWTLTGKPPNGYDMQPQTYTQMCSDISVQIQKTLGRAVVLPVAWRSKHRNDSVNDFITAVTIEVVSAKLTPTGKGALTWSLTK
jgi:hypothetical protein